MERRRIEWAVVLASFAATGLIMGLSSPLITNRVSSCGSSVAANSLSAFNQVSFPSSVVFFEFYKQERVVASLDNGNLECRNLSGDLLWRVNGIGASELRFTRDGKRLCVWSEENGVRVYDSDSGIQTASFQTTSPVAWSASDRYFVANANGKPVVCDINTGKLRSCAGADESKTAVSNEGVVYHLANSHITAETSTQTIQWNGVHRSSDKTRLDWSFIEQSHFGLSHITIDMKADFSNVTTIRISPDGDTLALGRESGVIELIGLSEMYNRSQVFNCFPAKKAKVVTVSSLVPLTWMEWLQEGALAVSYGSDAKEDYSLIDTDGTVIASQADKKQPWISAKGTFTLETRDGNITARRFLNASSGQSWGLNTPTAETDTPSRIYGESLAAVANGQTISFYEIPAP